MANRTAESREAYINTKPEHGPTREAILHLLVKNPKGLTSTEVAQLLNKEKHTFSSRLSELVRLGYAERTKDRRDGCAVLKAI